MFRFILFASHRIDTARYAPESKVTVSPLKQPSRYREYSADTLAHRTAGFKGIVNKIQPAKRTTRGQAPVQ